MIVLARVDSRLIHGQVLEGWIPYTGTSMVIVVDDHVAANPLQKRVMEMAVPEDIKLRIESLDEAVADLTSDRFRDERIMVIFSCPHDAFEAYKRGMKCESINLGNVNYTSGRMQVTPSIALNNEDVEDIKALMEMGVKIDVRGVPRERSKDIEGVIEEYYRLRRRQG